MNSLPLPDLPAFSLCSAPLLLAGHTVTAMSEVLVFGGHDQQLQLFRSYTHVNRWAGGGRGGGLHASKTALGWPPVQSGTVFALHRHAGANAVAM